MGKRGPKRNAAPPPPPLQKPQGVAGKRRTPTSAFDSAAGNDIYEPQKSAKDSTFEHSLFAAALQYRLEHVGERLNRLCAAVQAVNCHS